MRFTLFPKRKTLNAKALKNFVGQNKKGAKTGSKGSAKTGSKGSAKTGSKGSAKTKMYNTITKNKSNVEKHINLIRKKQFEYNAGKPAFKDELMNAIRKYQTNRAKTSKPIPVNLANNPEFVKKLLAKYIAQNSKLNTKPLPLGPVGYMKETRKAIALAKQHKSEQKKPKARAQKKPKIPKVAKRAQNEAAKAARKAARKSARKAERKAERKAARKSTRKSGTKVSIEKLNEYMNKVNSKMTKKVKKRNVAAAQAANRIRKAALKRARTAGLRRTMVMGSGVRRRKTNNKK